jgi:protein TonB
MRIAWLLGVSGAILLHALIILFGGLLLPEPADDLGTTREVELVAEAPEVEQEEAEKAEELETQTEQPPDAAEVLREIVESQVAIDDAPALEAASLAAIEAALTGQMGAGDFAQALGFQSGGRIGGTGEGAAGDGFEGAFSLAEIDQQPQAVLQGSPVYPPEMRGKKVEGVVVLLFVVDAAGKVVRPSVEKSSHPAFEAPALNAVRKWKYDAAVRGGRRVPCKVRQTIRFPPN